MRQTGPFVCVSVPITLIQHIPRSRMRSPYARARGISCQRSRRYIGRACGAAGVYIAPPITRGRRMLDRPTACVWPILISALRR
jgi:hypothetical protein